jgi:hypothetical protein
MQHQYITSSLSMQLDFLAFIPNRPSTSQTVHITAITILIFIFNDNTQDMDVARITQSGDKANNGTREESWFNS